MSLATIDKGSKGSASLYSIDILPQLFIFAVKLSTFILVTYHTLTIFILLKYNKHYQYAKCYWISLNVLSKYPISLIET